MAPSTTTQPTTTVHIPPQRASEEEVTEVATLLKEATSSPVFLNLDHIETNALKDLNLHEDSIVLGRDGILYQGEVLAIPCLPSNDQRTGLRHTNGRIVMHFGKEELGDTLEILTKLTFVREIRFTKSSHILWTGKEVECIKNISNSVKLKSWEITVSNQAELEAILPAVGELKHIHIIIACCDKDNAIKMLTYIGSYDTMPEKCSLTIPDIKELYINLSWFTKKVKELRLTPLITGGNIEIDVNGAIPSITNLTLLNSYATIYEYSVSNKEYKINVTLLNSELFYGSRKVYNSQNGSFEHAPNTFSEHATITYVGKHYLSLGATYKVDDTITIIKDQSGPVLMNVSNKQGKPLLDTILKFFDKKNIFALHMYTTKDCMWNDISDCDLYISTHWKKEQTSNLVAISMQDAELKPKVHTTMQNFALQNSALLYFDSQEPDNKMKAHITKNNILFQLNCAEPNGASKNHYNHSLHNQLLYKLTIERYFFAGEREHYVAAMHQVSPKCIWYILSVLCKPEQRSTALKAVETRTYTLLGMPDEILEYIGAFLFPGKCAGVKHMG